MTRIADLEAQFARLEAEAAPLRAALKAQGSIREDGKWHAKGCYPDAVSHSVRPCASWCAEARAALSSDAGKGWVSPEVAGEAREIIGARVAHTSGCRIRVGPDFKCNCGLADVLDALKGVE